METTDNFITPTALETSCKISYHVMNANIQTASNLIWMSFFKTT